MTFRSQIEPSVKINDYLCVCKNSDWKWEWTDGFLKVLNQFFFTTRERVKMHWITKTNQTRKLFGDFEVGVFFWVILNLLCPSGWF